jgi:hypothetical protein
MQLIIFTLLIHIINPQLGRGLERVICFFFLFRGGDWGIIGIVEILV